MGLLEYIQREWGVLKGAPLAFVILLCVGLGGGFAVGSAWRNPELVAKDTYIGQLEKDKAEYVALQQRMRDADKELTEQQISDLEKRLKDQAGSKVLFKTPRIGPSWAPDLQAAFKASGWGVDSAPTTPVESDLMMSWDKPVLLTIPNDASGQNVLAAFDAAKIPYASQSAPAGSTPQVWIKTFGVRSSPAPHAPARP